MAEMLMGGPETGPAEFSDSQFNEVVRGVDPAYDERVDAVAQSGWPTAAEEGADLPYGVADMTEIKMDMPGDGTPYGTSTTVSGDSDTQT